MSKPDLRISVISDVYVTHFGAGNKNLKNALAFHTKKLPKSDMFLFLGDIAYQLDSENDSVCKNIYTSNYDLILKTVSEELAEDTPRLFVLGNHEYPQNNTDPILTKKALDTWVSKLGQPPMEHVTLNGFHFIKYPTLSWSLESSFENERWAMNEINIALSADPGKPVFFLSHNALHNTVAHSGKEPYTFSEEFRRFLVQHPSVIHLSGHQHTHVLDDKAIYQEGFTSISAPVCGVGYITMEGCDVETNPVFGFSQSLLIEVTGTVIKIFKIDLVSKQIVSRPWIIDMADAAHGIFPYGKKARADAKRPQFAPDAAIAVYQKNNGVFALIRQKFLNFDVITQYYNLQVTDASGNEILQQTESTDFYNMTHGKPYAPEMVYRLHGLNPGAYRLRVYPLNCFFAPGQPLHCDFQVK